MPPPDDQLVIEPVAAPLSQRSGERPRRALALPGLGARAWWFGGALALLGAVALVVFVVLPERIDAPSQPPRGALAGKATPAAVETDAPPPFRALEMQRAREQAQEKLNDFMALHLELEEVHNVAAWGADDFAAAIDRANAGDALFQETKFASALLEYAAAATALENLTTTAHQRFDAALVDGDAALAASDHARAKAAFERASAMRGDEPRVAAGLARAAKLPEIARLLRESERARLRGEIDTARDLLLEARALDPETPRLAALLADVDAARRAERRKTLLSNAFAALEDGEYATALARFDDALRAFPNDAAALAGRQQTEQARTLAEIDALRETAAAQMRAEQWADALATFERALAIDPSLQFASEGRDAVAVRKALIDAMQRIVADPTLLSADHEFEAAQRTLAEATALRGAGDAFAARLARFETVLERAAVPIPLVLLSDNATEVTIHKVGPMGAFERRELALRPGRYVIVGSRDGCRDVRKEIVLAADTAPVDIRCMERI